MMQILWWAISGSIIGSLLDLIAPSRGGIIEDVLLGMNGAFIGGFIATLFATSMTAQPTIHNLFLSVICAMLLVGASKFFTSRKRHQRAM